MSISDIRGPLLHRAEAEIPRAAEGPLFPQAWHARVFALVVALVENGQLSWSAFQTRLAGRTSEKPSAADQHPGDIDDYYFGCWLAAAEETLEAEGLTMVE